MPKIMLKFAIFLSLFLFIFQLAWASGYRDPNTAQRWIGENVNNLIADWGQPDVRLNHENGRETLIYKIVTSQSYTDQRSPAVGVNVGSGGRPVVIVSGPPAMQQNNVNLKLICTVRFEVNQSGTVANAQSQGNGC